MDVIERFVAAYEREYDYWDAVAGMARSTLEAALNSSGLRAIVSSRAKSVDRLSQKLQQRNRHKYYQTSAEIREDIADLAGVRVALYFPGQMEEVEQIIRSTLDVVHVKQFPEHSTPVPMNSATGVGVLPTKRRFVGYGARHFRAHIPSESLTGTGVRYATAIVEIQVASVLMHAWSEVEHDLVYKPLEGDLSASEYALLDQLNGLVLAGEIALEQLQSAGDERLTAASSPFRNHFELAEFLRSRLSAFGAEVSEPALGRVDILFAFLIQQGLASATAVSPYLEQLERDFERRPVAEQLADLMLSGDRRQYDAYRETSRSARQHSSRLVESRDRQRLSDAASPDDIGTFIQAWADLETALMELLGENAGERKPAPFSLLLRDARRRALIPESDYARLLKIRELRNKLTHGSPDNVRSEVVRRAAIQVREIAARFSTPAH
ncbi:RelA/SpoT domain-containing protein [Pseudactinotalea terrae]|uniref:RelA/SpoT domain-containing protein n=1 Tax=Pseudactinotalea terrae TaxID=1743262 RepID=UPI0012E15894|nr:RelA/SpoT domain-containing protein [Pseudactinotalea terrae]